MAAAENIVSVRPIGGGEDDFSLVSAVRRTVFIEEQRVPEEEEWDHLDGVAVHLLAEMDGRAVGTLRFYEDDGWLHVGRVAVLRECRGAGVGRVLMERCLAEGRRMGLSHSFLNAQTDKAGFYRRLGYREVGGEFMEAGIPHVRMEREV